ncbi:MAG TPA: type II toxin-antitoxin system VapC family toxin [Candidatus Sulfotelmatobacter sp.]
MSLVLDASVALAWIYANETTNAILRVFEELKASGAWIPALWRWEVANALQMNVRRGRHGTDFRDAALSNLAWFPIQVDAQAEPEAWLGALRIAGRCNLTVYDASFLEIAQRRKLPLATLDRELRAAAEREKVRLLGI